MESYRKVDPLGSRRRTVASIYLHIPFCEHKCIYCDFYSVAPDDTRPGTEVLMQQFAGALKQEIELRGRESRFRVPFETVFLGGGTPSLMPLSDLEEMFQALGRSFRIDQDAEITIEVNPGTVDANRLRAYRELGINRLSMGIQSFHEDDLRFLTRIHSAEQARSCVRDAAAAGFSNVSLDLMFSLPGQTAERWRSNLEEAVALNPTHISCYSLIVEPQTPLAKMVEARQVSVLSVDADAALYEMTMEFLDGAGYEQYEVSNFAKPGYASRHNRNYWNHTPYLGFGPSAHSFWNVAGSGASVERWWNVSSVVGYCTSLTQGALPLSGSERLTEKQLEEEEIFLALRSDGVNLDSFKTRFGKDLISDPAYGFRELIDRRLAILDGARFRLTPRGYLVCDEICASLHL